MKKYILLAVTSLGFSTVFSNMVSAQFVQIEVKPAPIRKIYQPENYFFTKTLVFVQEHP